ncbi:28S ribosomal protein S24, mitochondrial [Alligator mississippiensis]|uniref:28S ribosomal protein S24, mitochondrial n=1 Tax=Alligator mississippiensis TaxID=8496 RepID=A0A151MMD9_ALLMI|nr:28S ribosomal protein S24, mitochondrial [Alligator mississippiensis]
MAALLCRQNWAARVRVSKGKKLVTYEAAHPPHYIAHRKGWLSQHTSNLDSEEGAAERLVEDVFIRRFLHGTFVGLLAQEPVLKRRANVLIICLVLFQNIAPAKIYFLAAYTETLFSHFYKCPVKLEFQTVSSMLVYKYLCAPGPHDWMKKPLPSSASWNFPRL